ncbi:MAG: polysaccharide deacetylase family protein [Smithellaceae bacterium]
MKIDVDTYVGMKNGVPCLLKLLKENRIKATFFLSIGPDNSGRAVLQLIKNPRFLKKMLKTNAPGLYGWKTSLYGTLLPAPMIALSFPEIVAQIITEGHEVQFHAWDHRRWQDDLPCKTDEWIRQWFQLGIEGFEKLTGSMPTAFGAPSWLIDNRVLSILSEYPLDYLSCTRAKKPFVYETNHLLEIPSDLPCFEELDQKGSVNEILDHLRGGGMHVLPVHAEVEGGLFQEKFRELLRGIFNKGFLIGPLREMKSQIDVTKLDVRDPGLALIPGRHSPCAV